MGRPNPADPLGQSMPALMAQISFRADTGGLDFSGRVSDPSDQPAIPICRPLAACFAPRRRTPTHPSEFGPGPCWSANFIFIFYFFVFLVFFFSFSYFFFFWFLFFCSDFCIFVQIRKLFIFLNFIHILKFFHVLIFVQT
jgi:hypothetical protein